MFILFFTVIIGVALSNDPGQHFHIPCNCLSLSNCDSPYLINCNKSLNVHPPRCLEESNLYRPLFDAVEGAILHNKAYLDFATLIQQTGAATDAPSGNCSVGGAPNSAQFYNCFFQILLDAFASQGKVIVPGTPSPRVLLTESDGTVIIDSARAWDQDNTNTVNQNNYQNWKNKKINENHNSRVAILSTQLYSCGVGYEAKYSSSVDSNQAYAAIRVGRYLNGFGAWRLSENVNLPTQW